MDRVRALAEELGLCNEDALSLDARDPNQIKELMKGQFNQKNSSQLCSGESSFQGNRY